MSKSVIKNKGIKVNEPRADQATPLFIASPEGHTQNSQSIIKNKVNVNKVNVKGVTHYLLASQEDIQK